MFTCITSQMICYMLISWSKKWFISNKYFTLYPTHFELYSDSLETFCDHIHFVQVGWGVEWTEIFQSRRPASNYVSQYITYNDETWASWLLKSSENRLFVQQLASLLPVDPLTKDQLCGQIAIPWPLSNKHGIIQIWNNIHILFLIATWIHDWKLMAA